MARTATNVLTVSVLVAMLLAIDALLSAYVSGMHLPFASVEADMIVYKTERSSDGPRSGIRLPFGRGLFSPQEVGAIGDLEHVRDVSGALVLWAFRRDGFIAIEGVEPSGFVGVKLRSWITNGTFLGADGSGGAVLEGHFARFHHRSVGDAVDLGSRSLTITGLLKVGEGGQITSSNVYVTMDDARDLGNIQGYSKLYVRVDDVSREAAVRTAIERMDPGMVVVSGSTVGASLDNVARIYERFSMLGLGMLVIIASLILFKVNALGVLERRREIGIMQAVGWTKRDITLQLVGELSVQACAGFLVGVLAALVVVAVLGTITVKVMPDGLGEPMGVTMPLAVSRESIAQCLVLTASVSLSVSVFLARRFACRHPSENLRMT